MSRTSYADGLGRLIEVAETGIGANTFYAYDALDDLIAVTPPGGFAGRSFSYSSLKRLNSASNPKSGTTFYTYDPNGNLLTRASGGVTTTNTYDELDELTGKNYNDTGANATPWASYTYSKGWRTSAFAGSTNYAYTTFDGLGRATAATQTTSGAPYAFTYSYNLIDEITSMTMPSGTVVTTGYDSLGRATTSPLGGNEVAVDAVAGIAGGAVGHLAGTFATDVMHVPNVGPRPMPGRNYAVRLAAYNARKKAVRKAETAGFAIATGVGTPLAHATASGLQNGWLNFSNSFILLNLASAASPDSQGGGSRVVCYFDEGGVCRQ